MRYRVLIGSLFVLLSCAKFTAAQDNPALETGMKPFGQYEYDEIDSISLVNSNVHLHIPLASYPQRGEKLKFGFMIVANNEQWSVALLGTAPNTWYQWTPGATGGARVAKEGKFGGKTFYIIGCSRPQCPRYTVFKVESFDGSTHYLGTISHTLYETIDATGIRWQAANANSLGPNDVAIGPDGIRHEFHPPATGYPALEDLEDTNGNLITESSSGWTDTLNRQIPGAIAPAAPGPWGWNNSLLLMPGLATTDLSQCPSGTTVARVWNLPGPNAGTSVMTLCYQQMQFTTNFGVSGDREGNDSDETVLTGVALPNQTKWLFTYDNYGDLTSVTLPTGATITYTWQNETFCNTWMTPLTRALSTRTLNANDGSAPRVWRYTWQVTVNGQVGNIVTDPEGNDTFHAVSGCGAYITRRQYFQGSASGGTLLKTIDLQYTVLPNPYAGILGDYSGDEIETAQTTTWSNGKVRQNMTSYDPGFTFTNYNPNNTGTTQYTTPYGAIVEKDDYDYGQNAPGPILKSETTSYIAFANSSYLNNNLLTLPSRVAAFNGSPATGSCSTLSSFASCLSYGYDETQYPLAPSGITTQHDANPPASPSRGNATTVSRWLLGGTALADHSVFYDTGTVYQSIDPKNNTTTYTYGFVGAYVTQTKLPDTYSPNLAHHVTLANYDFNTGLLTSSTDQNGNATSFSYDNLWRVMTITYPLQNVQGQVLNGVTNFFYPDMVTVEEQKKLDGTRWTDRFILSNGFGQEIRRATANGEPTPWDQIDTCYNPRGLKAFVSYPYQGSGLSASKVCSGAGDSFSYDGLGRIESITHSDGAAILTSYSGAATSTTDESGVQEISQVDGLEHVIDVCEVSSKTLAGISPTPSPCALDIGATGFLTTYMHDALGNLLSVSQGGLNPRSFTYDPLSRLTQSSNPETGTIKYFYTNIDGTLCSGSGADVCRRTDARGTTTTYTYDPVYRQRTRTYSDSTPMVTINYDESSSQGVTLSNTVGRKSSEGTAGSSRTGAIFSYDTMGRIVDNSQCTPQNCGSGIFPVAYTYDLVGDMLTKTNGVGGQISIGYNVASRPVSVTSNLNDANHPATLMSSLHYNAFGSELSGTLGNQAINETFGYTARGRMNSEFAGTVYSFNLTYAGNENVQSASDSVNANWTYGYDDFNRLVSATGPQSISFTYDRFGNRWSQSGGTNLSSLAFDNNNHIIGSGVSYDSAGNELNDGVHAYTYDAENRIIQVDGGATATYTYDAMGRRARKVSAAGTVDYVHDFNNHDIGEIPAGGVWNQAEVFLDERHVASYAGGSTGSTYFVHADWLGTERARSGMAGSLYETCSSLPFGDGMQCSSPDISQLHFTGKRRDPESNLDDFPARYYSSLQGRWVTPDWSAAPNPVPYAEISDPQSLNLYAYAGNNPTTRRDMDGHCPQCVYIGVVVTAAVGAYVGHRINDVYRNWQIFKALGEQVQAEGQLLTEVAKRPGDPCCIQVDINALSAQYQKDQIRLRIAGANLGLSTSDFLDLIEKSVEVRINISSSLPSPPPVAGHNQAASSQDAPSRHNASMPGTIFKKPSLPKLQPTPDRRDHSDHPGPNDPHPCIGCNPQPPTEPKPCPHGRGDAAQGQCGA